MENDTLHLISFAVAVISGALLFWRGLQLGMIRRYPLAYGYVTVTLLAECLAEVLSRQIGVNSLVYTASYAWIYSAHAAVGIAVVWRVYFLHRKPSLVDLHFLGFAALLLTRPFFWADAIWISYRVLTAAQMTLIYFGICAIARLLLGSRMISAVGSNLAMVVIAVTLPLAFQSFILTYYLFGANAFSDSVTRTGIDLTSLAAWLILVGGLWNYSPPSRVKRYSERMRRKTQARIWANIKTLWGLR